MASDAGHSGGAQGLLSLGGDDPIETAMGLEDGFLKGKLGRTRFGENERFMATAIKVLKILKVKKVWLEHEKFTEVSFSRKEKKNTALVTNQR